MPIAFDNSFVFNHGRPQTVEEAIRVYCSWARLNQFTFLDFYYASELVPSGTIIFSETPVGTDFVMTYRIESAEEHGVVFLYENASNYWYALLDGSNFLVYRVIEDTPTLLYSHPMGRAYEKGNFIWAVRQQTFSSEESDVWLGVSCWVNDKLIGCHGSYVGVPQTKDYYAGVLGESVTMTNVRIPQLRQFVEWASLDPGEPLIGGLERMLDGRYVRYFLRHNGKIKAWRAAEISPSLDLDDPDEIEMLSSTRDRRQVFNHVRMLGAFVEAEYVDTALVTSYGHRFQEIQNPYLMTEGECYAEAKAAIKRSLETEISEQIQSPYTPLLEPEDRVDTPTGPRIIERIDRKVSPAGIMDQGLTLRAYAQDA